MNNELLTVENLHKSYKNDNNEILIINNINLSIKNKLITAIVGESGAGKSTLLYMLGGLLQPSDGHVFFEEIDIYNLKPNKLANLINDNIGFIFQDYQLLADFNVIENICLSAMLKQKRTRQANNYIAKANVLLERLNIKELAFRSPSQLSGGEKQRVAVCRALINDPKLILCDEPTGSLDSKNSQEVIRLIRELKNDDQHAIVIVTHDNSVKKIADILYTIKDGQIKKAPN